MEQIKNKILDRTFCQNIKVIFFFFKYNDLYSYLHFEKGDRKLTNIL